MVQVLVGAIIALVPSIPLFYWAQKRYNLNVTKLVKIAVLYFLAISLFFFVFDLTDAFIFSWPLQEYRISGVVNYGVIIFIFIMPIVLRSSKYIIFSFLYMLFNYLIILAIFLSYNLVTLILGQSGYTSAILTGETFFITLVKFTVLLVILLKSLEKRGA